MKDLNIKFIKICLLLNALAVIFGAFGAHYLAERLALDSLNAFKTGVLYQFLHATALIILNFNSKYFDKKLFNYASLIMLIGIIFFSGSIFLLTTKSLTGIGFLKILGPMTPLGGSFLIIGWLLFFFSFNKV